MKSTDPIEFLRVRENTFVREVSYHPVLESTNTTAIALIASPEQVLPLLVIADRQTAGRGRGANRWWSSAGSLTFTVVVEATGLDLRHVSKASLTCGLAICQALEQFVPQGDFALKWPNDVYLEGKKVCGILIERPATNESRLVIGIGINVSNSLQAAPVEIRALATSLADNTGTAIERTSVLVACLNHLEQRMDDLSRDHKTLLDQWRAYCLLTGRQVTIDMYGTVIQGTCRGIDADGALIVQSPTQTHRCLGGMIREFS